jgi:hypothetical protein
MDVILELKWAGSIVMNELKLGQKATSRHHFRLAWDG